MKKRFLILGNLLVIFTCFLFFAVHLLDRMDHAVYDFDMRQAANHQPNEHIVIIGVDDKSLSALGKFPWDRSLYVPLLKKLNAPGQEAKVIAFDILFDTKSKKESDTSFAQALSHYHNIIFPVYGNTESQQKTNQPITTSSVVLPYSLFAPFVHIAHINRPIDEDGLIRNTWLQIKSANGDKIPSLALETVKYSGGNIQPYLHKNERDEIPIAYENSTNDFTTIPFISVLSGQVPASYFKNKIVLIGYTAVGLGQDGGPTPVDKNMKMIYVHANIINQMLEGIQIKTKYSWLTLLLILFFCGITLLFTWRSKTLFGIFVLLLLFIGIFVVQIVLFEKNQLFIHSIYPATAMLLSYIYNVAGKSYFDTKKRVFITRQFSKYVSPALVKEIVKNEQEINLGGVNKELSILFIDIRGFTALSEKMAPGEVVSFLNMFFNMITEKALANQGTIDKFIGDAAMILFNAPLDVNNHPYYAVKTAYEIQQEMENLRSEIDKKYNISFHVGMGINTGEVIVGNMGSYLQMNYTAIGDQVNIASRIESSTDANQILVSESTYNRTKDEFDYLFAGEKELKGKALTIKTYEVTGLKERKDESE